MDSEQLRAEYVSIDTPDGSFTIVVSSDAVIASGWAHDVQDLLGTVHECLRPVYIEEASSTNNGILGQAIAAVAHYYEGEPGALATIPVRQQSGKFRELVWQTMRAIHSGEQVSYAELAARAGNPRAARAAASACSHNSAMLFVPCHRIVRSDGTTGEYRYGKQLKRRLLQRESLDGA